MKLRQDRATLLPMRVHVIERRDPSTSFWGGHVPYGTALQVGTCIAHLDDLPPEDQEHAVSVTIALKGLRVQHFVNGDCYTVDMPVDHDTTGVDVTFDSRGILLHSEAAVAACRFIEASSIPLVP